MGNSCCSCTKKTSASLDDDILEERPCDNSDRQGKKRKHKKKRSKAYKPRNDASNKGGNDGDTATHSQDVIGPKNVVVVEKNIGSENAAVSSQGESSYVTNGGQLPKRGSDGSFVNAVFVHDNPVEKVADQTTSENTVTSNSNSQETEKESNENGDTSCNGTIPNLDASSTSPVRKISQPLDTTPPKVVNPQSNDPADYMEVSDMGTQLSPEAGCYATQEPEGPDRSNHQHDSEYPFRLKKSNKLSAKLKSKRRKASSAHCDDTVNSSSYPFSKGSHLRDIFSDNMISNDLSSAVKIKFVTKGLRVPVYYISDDAVDLDDSNNAKTTMTIRCEDDEDEGIDASELSEVRIRRV